MTSSTEFEDFLADLAVQRARLLHLVDPDSSPGGRGTPWSADLSDLAAKLLLADEELRVQKEELLDAGRRLKDSAAENESHFQHSRQPQMVSDLRGKVLRRNTVADHLVRRRPDQTGHPVASWFQVSDRGRIRTLISRMNDHVRSRQAGSAAMSAVLILPGSAHRTVTLTVRTAMNTASGLPELHWELLPPSGAAAPRGDALLRLVPGPTVPVTPAPVQRANGSPQTGPAVSDPDLDPLSLAETLAVLAGRLATCNSDEDVFRAVLAGVFTLLPDVHSAAVTRPGRAPDPIAVWSGDAALACERTQLLADGSPGLGPAPQALAQGRRVLVSFPEMSRTWPDLGNVAKQFGVQQILAVPIASGKQPAGTLSLYSTQPDVFGSVAQRITALLGLSASTALTRLERERNLQTALLTRQSIGEAVGILVERHRILPAAAFDLLVLSSQRKNVKVREVAEMVVRTGQDPQEVTPAG